MRNAADTEAEQAETEFEIPSKMSGVRKSPEVLVRDSSTSVDATEESHEPRAQKLQRRRSSDPVDVSEFDGFYGVTDRAKKDYESPGLMESRSRRGSLVSCGRVSSTASATSVTASATSATGGQVL